MPWKEQSPMDQKKFLIDDFMHGDFTVTELANRYGVSCKTTYKWIRRFQDQGREGLADRSRRPHTSPYKTSDSITVAILLLRKRHPLWGAKKLLWVLEQRHPDVDWPARSTVCDLLKRNDMIKDKRRRSYPGHPGRPTTPMDVSYQRDLVR